MTLQETIARGEIGDIVHVRLRRLSPGRIRTNENVWWSFAPHDVALMLSLLGEPESYSACEHARMQEGISDFVYADLQFDAGRTAHIEVSWLDPDKSSRIDVFGTRGVISVETARAVSTLVKRSFRADRPSEGVLPTSYGEPIVESFPGIDPLRDELQAFLRWVQRRSRSRRPTSPTASASFARWPRSRSKAPPMRTTTASPGVSASTSATACDVRPTQTTLRFSCERNPETRPRFGAQRRTLRLCRDYAAVSNSALVNWTGSNG